MIEFNIFYWAISIVACFAACLGCVFSLSAILDRKRKLYALLTVVTTAIAAVQQFSVKRQYQAERGFAKNLKTIFRKEKLQNIDNYLKSLFKKYLDLAPYMGFCVKNPM